MTATGGKTGVLRDVNPIVDGVIDVGVIVGYPSERGRPAPLSLGPGPRLRTNSVLYGASTIGRGFTTGHNVVIREECEIGDDVSVWTNSVVDYGCRIGNRVKIHSNCYVAQFTEIGDDAFLAPGVSIANDLYPGSEQSAAVMRGPVIGAGAQIGVGVTILPYVVIGEGAMIGSGAVVTKDIPAGMVAVGNPAIVTKAVKELAPIEDRIGDRHRPGERAMDETDGATSERRV
ncbi:MAG: acyltransferase [Actinomycetota bacterium]